MFIVFWCLHFPKKMVFTQTCRVNQSEHPHRARGRSPVTSVEGAKSNFLPPKGWSKTMENHRKTIENLEIMGCLPPNKKTGDNWISQPSTVGIHS